MKVAHVINQAYGHAGAEVSLRDIVTTDTSGIDHAVIVLRSDLSDVTPFEEAGIPCLMPSRERLTRLGQVRHVQRGIRELRPDLVHTSLFDADTAGRIAAFLQGVPVVSSLVNTPYAREVAEVELASPAKLKAVRWIDRLLARHFTSALHAISHATAEHAVEHLGVPSGRIRIVPRGRSRSILGQPSQDRRERVRRAWGWGSRPVVINVARQEPQKGHLYLLDAFVDVLARHPDALLVLVGREGRSTPAIDARIRALGLDKAIAKLGTRMDVPDLVCAADVFAFPSLYEGLGGAAVEALGLGTPIVASDVPALRELLGSNRGWLVAPKDSQALAATICEVLSGGQEVSATTEAARKFFLRHYEIDTCVAGMVRLYRDIEALLEGHPGRRFRRPYRLDLSSTQ